MPTPTPTQPILKDSDLKNLLDLNIENIKKSQARIETSLNKSKEEVKTAILNGLKECMAKEDFENNEKYIEWLGKRKNGPKQQEIWLGSLSVTEQIDLLAEYGIDAEIEEGKNSWEKDIDKAQKSKDITKKAMMVEAKKIINSFRNLLITHKKTIESLEQAIKQKEKEINDKSKEISKMELSKNDAENNKERLAAIVKIQEELNADKKVLEDKLEDYQKIASVYEEEINNAIAEFEEKMKDEDIYIGSYEGLGNTEAPTQATQNNSQGYVQSGYGEIDERKPSEIAKAMMVDFDNLAPSEINEMIEHSGYGDLLQMSRNLGPLNRRKLRKSMENRLDDKNEGITFEDENGNSIMEISLEELKDLRNLEDDKFNFMINMVKHYADNYESMRVHERQEAERVMEYFKMSVLLAESDTNRIGRFFRKFSNAGKRIEELGAELNRFSKKRGIREDKKWSKKQSLREMLKVKTKAPVKERKRRIDRSGTNKIKYPDGR